MNIILQTPRLILRQFEPTEANLLLDLNSDEAIVKYVHEPTLKTIDEATYILENIILPQYQLGLGRWACFTGKENTFIGWCGLKYIREKDEIDLGYRFKQIFWGNGYATESANAVLKYGFETLQLNKIVGRAHIENLASIRVLEKIGLIYSGEAFEDNCPVKCFYLENPTKSKEMLKK